MKKLFGVGISNNGKYPRYVKDTNGKKKPSREYRLWANMLNRCYSEKELERNPCYTGCTVSENFKDFQYFAEWCNNQVGFKEGYCLDKDLLVKGNKLYSEQTCLFIPKKINTFLTTSKRSRGKFPIGVSFHKKLKKYQATGGYELGYLGVFDTIEDAFITYKKAKESLARLLAEEFFSHNVDNRCLQALKNYTVEIND